MRAHEFIVEFKDWTELTRPKKPQGLLPPKVSPIKKPKKVAKTPERSHGAVPTPKVGNTQGWKGQ